MLALIGLFAGMGADVLLKVAQLCEASLTYSTAIRLDPCMDTGMLRQVGRVGKTLLARLALIGFGVLLMDMLTVHEQVGFRVEDLEHKAERRQSPTSVLLFCFCFFLVCFFSLTSKNITAPTWCKLDQVCQAR